MGLRLFVPDFYYWKGQAYQSLGNFEEAWKALEAGKDVAERIGSKRVLWLILDAMRDVSIERGNYDQAESCRSKAAEIVRYIADRAGHQDLHNKFLKLPQVARILSPNQESRQESG
jgi:tetratricopeptide (TPR) repeat protein